MTFDYDPVVAERCTPIDTGGRNLDFIIDRAVLPEVSEAMLAKMAEEQIPAKLTLGMDEAGNFTYGFV
jgi:type VI secretion system protein VasG